MYETLPRVTSPALEHGVLTWCEGDVFNFFIKIKLSSLGEAIEDLTGYFAEAAFFDTGRKCVHTFSEELGNDCVFTLEFDAGATSDFPRGRYSFDIYLTTPDSKRITLANDVAAIVR
ncbi:MAG: hypothetical protein IKN38_10635 [Clostridia bacterium]|nr:hypothetical protein [Clostridia bacterium]